MTEKSTLTQPEGTYWHFLRDDRCLAYSDGREVTVGETLTVDGEIELCNHGLHASERAMDALKYAPGSVVCLVTLGGKVLHTRDKSVAEERTTLWVYDATRLLREFACNVAEDALVDERNAGREPDPRSFAAIEVARRYAKGEATEEERNEAYEAALSELYSAADRSTDSVEYRTAYSAAYSAAYSVAYRTNERVTHRVAHRTAYSVAHNSAIQQKQNEVLTSMLMHEYNKEKQN